MKQVSVNGIFRKARIQCFSRIVLVELSLSRIVSVEFSGSHYSSLRNSPSAAKIGATITHHNLPFFLLRISYGIGYILMKFQTSTTFTIKIIEKLNEITYPGYRIHGHVNYMPPINENCKVILTIYERLQKYDDIIVFYSDSKLFTEV